MESKPMESVVAVTTPTATPTPVKNYIKDFYAAGEHDYSSFFNTSAGADVVINSITKKIKNMNKEIEKESGKLAKAYAAKYSEKYTPTKRKALLCYQGRNSSKHYFSFPDGLGIIDDSFDPSEYDVYDLCYKTGDLEIILGYAYDIAGVVSGYYKYSISGDNKNVKLRFINEELHTFLDNKRASSTSVGQMFEATCIPRCFSKASGDEFVNTIYGSNIQTGINLENMFRRKKANQSFETIIKTAPNSLIAKLINLDSREPQAVYKLMNVSKEIYEDAIKRGIERELFNLREFVSQKAIFNISEPEWLDLIEKCNDFEKDLDFYSISYYNNYWMNDKIREGQKLCGGLLYGFARWYDDYPILRDNYSLGKLINYVVNETTNQGYTSVSRYTEELRDYLGMCRDKSIKPSLYTNSLKITHDIATRNLNITVSTEEENIFVSQYEGFKPFKKNGYKIIAPSRSEDVKIEGAELCHCSASYIKRIIKGETKLFFLRQDPVISLITMEVKEGKIIQVRGCSNRGPLPEEAEVVKAFAEDRGLIIDY